ncbi:MAG: hypothetical protein ACK52S_04645 [Pirellula sp.]|jgi:hypothetical protein
MVTGIGLWYNPQSDTVFPLGYFTHDEWLKSEERAEALGISFEMQQVILSETDIDVIRLAATMEGMVRIRDHRRRISVQFYVDGGLMELLHKILKVLENQDFDVTAPLDIDNLRTGESKSVSIVQLRQSLASNAPILLKEVGKTAPNELRDHPHAEKIRLAKIQSASTGSNASS